MDNWKELTLGDLVKGLTRYRPFIAAVAAIVLVLVAFPSDSRPVSDDGNATALRAGDRVPVDVDGDGIDDVTGQAVEEVTGDTALDGIETDQSSVTTTPTLSTINPASLGPDCDLATNTVRIPTRAKPPCVPTFSGDNGGATYQGVSAKEIKVVYYQAKADPAVSAALTAAGASNTEPEQEATLRDYVEIFNKHFPMYGRQVKIEVKKGSGDSDDDAAGRADAVDIATRIKPFAVFGAPATNAFPAELAARKILCICTVSQPQEFYEQHAPYVGYTTLMSSTQGYIHRAEYIAKRLNGRNAVHAGTPVMQQQKRKFGLLYYDTPDHGYRVGADFFVKHLKEKYGISLAAVKEYPSDYVETQEKARSIIQNFVNSGVTSVICACDPIAPALFTKEATNQRYFPEWVITGSALTDTTIFARTYDAAQWRNAFGVSFLTLRGDSKQSDAYRVYKWHFGEKEPAANNQYQVIYPTPLTLALGIAGAGPNLTVQSWQKGLFAFPATNKGMVTAAQYSYGNQGVWSATDYTALDDVTEIFWDPNAVGADETGKTAPGMYRYVAGGKRYLPGQHPTTDPKVFVNEGAPTTYTQNPDPPVTQYEHKHYYANQ